MQLVCPECSTSYRIGDDAIGAAGRDIKCARCGHGWHQDPGPAVAAAAAEETPAQPAESEPETVTEEPADASDAGDAGSDTGDAAADAEPGPGEEPEGETGGGDAISEPAASSGEHGEADDGAGEAESEPAEGAGDAAEDVADAEIIEVEPRTRPVRDRRPPPRPSGRRGGLAWAALVVVMVALAAGAFSYRAEIVKAWPPAGKFYRTVGVGMPAQELGLEIIDVDYSQERKNGKTILLITGNIANVGIDEQRIPELRIILYDDKKRELNHWTAPIAKDRLAPGEKVPFSTRLADPPKKAKDFKVTFVLRR